MPRSLRLSLLLAPLLLLLSGQPVLAQTPSGALDVILLIDDSGSMSDWWASGTRAPNDPDGLRHSAARLFIDLAQPNDRIAVISFHSFATGYGAAAQGGFDVITDQAARERLKAAIVQPTEPADPNERLTDIRLGLRLAQTILTNNPSSNRRFIVFLTDGRPFPPEQRGELFQVIRELGQAGVPIFPILLGADTDPDVAERMVADTRSVAQQVDSASGLLRAYAAIYSYIQPNRYVDVVDLVGGQVGAVRTSDAQGVTALNFVLPKTRNTEAAFADLTLDGAPILGASQLSNGAALSRVAEPHYEMVTIAHNRPLAGEWTLRALQAAGASGLVVAESTTTIDLLYPRAPADADSTAAPRRYPVGKPIFVGATVRRSGALTSDLPVIARWEGVQYPLTTERLSKDGTLYWTKIPAQAGVQPGQRARLQVQIGDQVTPLRLQKEFILEAGQFAPLVADSPTERSDGLIEGGRLLLRAHFDGVPPAEAQVEALVQDQTTGEVTRVTLACAGGLCEDRSFMPVQGRRYAVLFLATARTAEGVVYDDFAEGGLAIRDALRIEELPAILDLGNVPLYQDRIERELALTAYTQKEFALGASVELQSETPGVRPTALSVALARPTLVGGDRYRALFTLSGFDQLAPGRYTGVITFRAGPDIDVQPATLPIQFAIPQPEIRLSMPNSVDLGEIRQPREPHTFEVSAEFTEGTASEIEARLINLTMGGQAADANDFTVLVGQPKQVGEDRRRYMIPVQLTAVTRPPAGVYQGQIVFSSPSGLAVEPRQIQVVFTVPQPELLVMLEGDVLDFGDAYDLAQPTSRSLRFQLTYKDNPPRVDATLADVRHSGGDTAAARSLSVRTGVIQADGDGYRMPLLVSAEGQAPPGLYQGVIVLHASDGVTVRPARIGFAVRQLTTAQAWAKRLSPAAAFLRRWFWPLPLLQPTGLVGWFVLLVLINTGLRLRPAAPKEGGVVVADASGETVIVPNNRPLYLVMGRNGVEFSVRPADRARALAIIALEQRVLGRSTRATWRPVLRPNPLGPVAARVAYWRPEASKWRAVHEGGYVLSSGSRFRVRLAESDEKYIFRYMDER